MPFLLAIFLFVAGFAAPGWADSEPAPQPATFAAGYNGGYKDDYPQELVRVQSYVLAVQSDIATQLGLQYGQGFIHPVTIRFTDGAPADHENPFFYVQTKGSEETFRQDLVVNVEAYAMRRDELNRREGDLRSGFRYALTQVMLNDITAGARTVRGRSGFRKGWPSMHPEAEKPSSKRSPNGRRNPKPWNW